MQDYLRQVDALAQQVVEELGGLWVGRGQGRAGGRGGLDLGDGDGLGGLGGSGGRLQGFLDGFG